MSAPKESDMQVQEQQSGEKRKIGELIAALRSIQQMSLQAKKGPAHVAKLTLEMMADVAAEAISKATGKTA
jgi:hypothetical protein